MGQDTWEKIDKGVAGANYGWPMTENATKDPRFQNPLYAYNHGNNDRNGGAITGGAFYNPSRARFPKAYVGKYFFVDIKGSIRTYNPANGKGRGVRQEVAPRSQCARRRSRRQPLRPVAGPRGEHREPAEDLVP